MCISQLTKETDTKSNVGFNFLSLWVLKLHCVWVVEAKAGERINELMSVDILGVSVCVGRRALCEGSA